MFNQQLAASAAWHEGVSVSVNASKCDELAAAGAK
jgi:hypothetical protein